MCIKKFKFKTGLLKKKKKPRAQPDNTHQEIKKKTLVKNNGEVKEGSLLWMWYTSYIVFFFRGG
jgi:hypothetical protein